MTILAGPEILPRMCELLDGTVLFEEELVPLLPTVDVDKIVFHDDGRTLTHYQSRCFPDVVRKAVRGVYRTRFHPCCDVPAHLCEVDHVTPYCRGGETSFANARPACGFHNRARNAEMGLPPTPAGVEVLERGPEARPPSNRE